MAQLRNHLFLARSKLQLASILIVMLFFGVFGVRYLLSSHAATTSADINSDGVVNIVDLSIMATNWGKSGQTFAQGDLNNDGIINILDLSILASKWGAQQPLLGALDPSASYSSLSTSGFHEVVIGASWADIEPSQDSYSASAVSNLQAQINTALAAGLTPSLDIGTQYAPAWVFTVGGGVQFKDQYGDVFSGSPSSGNDVANTVTDANARNELGNYIAYLGSHLTGISSIRLGGGPFNELRYPSGQAGSQANAYWFYDNSSQTTLPADVRGWVPGTGSTAQATEFLSAYNNAMTNYGIWLVQQAAAAFPTSTKLEVILPGWGERPGEVASAESNLLSNTNDELNQGLDWIDMLSQLPSASQVVAYSTFADATTGGGTNPDPAAFIHSILPAGMLAGGESTGNGNTSDTGMNLMFQDAKQWNWYVVNWFFNGQAQTPDQVAQSFISN